jgi:hypothetical protein
MISKYLTHFLFLIFVLFTVTSHSSAKKSYIWKDANRSAQDTYYFLSEENEKYILSKIRVPKDRLQEVLETHSFSSYQDAVKFLGLKKGIFSVQEKDLQFSKLQTEVPGVLWPTLNEWSWDWEIKYSEWIKENFNEDFFIKYNLRTDCADVAISLRWIFARINFLPAAQTTVLSNRVFSNESVRAEWKNLPTSANWYEDKKFLAGLDFILENTFTHSLYLDSYPIAIDKSTLLLGSHYLKLREGGGHTLIVAEFMNGKTIYTLSSDVPREVRKMDRYGFWYTYQPKYYPVATAGGGGFVHMRWPRKIAEGYELVPGTEMPFYSLEQYAEDFIKNPRNDFAEEIHNRLGNTMTPSDRYNDAVTRLIGSYKARVGIVEQGQIFCSTHDCTDGTENYENYSTPARDARILETIKIIKQVMADFGEVNTDIVSDWNSRQESVVVTIEEHPLTLSELVHIWEESLYSYDPAASVLRRWGL